MLPLRPLRAATTETSKRGHPTQGRRCSVACPVTRCRAAESTGATSNLSKSTGSRTSTVASAPSPTSTSSSATPSTSSSCPRPSARRDWRAPDAGNLLRVSESPTQTRCVAGAAPGHPRAARPAGRAAPPRHGHPLDGRGQTPTGGTRCPGPRRASAARDLAVLTMTPTLGAALAQGTCALRLRTHTSGAR